MKPASLALLAALAAASVVAAADQAPLIQNTRVRVWNVPPGAAAPTTDPTRDVVTFVIRGDRANVETAVLSRARTSVAPGAPADARRIVIELQDATVPPLANTSGYQLGFPRPGSLKLFENERVVVWSSTWTPGVGTPMHFHDKDVVVTFLADGALTSIDPQGRSTTNERRFGDTSFNARDRTHIERLDRGQGRAMMVELK